MKWSEESMTHNKHLGKAKKNLVLDSKGHWVSAASYCPGFVSRLWVAPWFSSLAFSGCSGRIMTSGCLNFFFQTGPPHICFPNFGECIWTEENPHCGHDQDHVAWGTGSRPKLKPVFTRLSTPVPSVCHQLWIQESGLALRIRIFEGTSWFLL